MIFTCCSISAEIKSDDVHRCVQKVATATAITPI